MRRELIFNLCSMHSGLWTALCAAARRTCFSQVPPANYPSIFWSSSNCLSACFADCTRGDERVLFGEGIAAVGIVPAGMDSGSTAGRWPTRGLRRAPPAPAGLGGSNESTSINGRLPRILLGSPVALIAPRT